MKPRNVLPPAEEFGSQADLHHSPPLKTKKQINSTATLYGQSCCPPYFLLADLQEEIIVGIFDDIWHLYMVMHMEKAKGVQPLK